MIQSEVDAYINQLPYNDFYTSLPDETKSKVVFAAWEMLRRRFGAAVITNEMTALQTLYFVEGEKEEFAKFRRHGLSNVQVEDLRMNFSEKMVSPISPEVLAIIETLQEGTPTDTTVIFGRLI